jgi:cell division protein FtsB
MCPHASGHEGPCASVEVSRVLADAQDEIDRLRGENEGLRATIALLEAGVKP